MFRGLASDEIVSNVVIVTAKINFILIKKINKSVKNAPVWSKHRSKG